MRHRHVKLLTLLLFGCATSPPVAVPSAPERARNPEAICPSFASWDRSGSQLLASTEIFQQQPVTVVAFFASWCKACGPQLLELGRALEGDSRAGILLVLSGERYGQAKKKLDNIERSLGRKLQLVEDGSREVSRLFGVCQENDAESVCNLPAIRVCSQKGKQLLALDGAKKGNAERVRSLLP